MSAIAVYCASITRIDPIYLELATAVGAAIGGRGHTLVTGGGSVAMMGAVGVAARAAGASGAVPVEAWSSRECLRAHWQETSPARSPCW